jgi:anti-sigma factor RsiW
MTDKYTPDEVEFDLMAYVDGHLEDDPQRKAKVEDRLRASPADAARVAAYRAQNAALRRRYGRRVDDAVPERLYRILRDRPLRPARAAARVAAVLALTTAAGLSGWWLGRSAPPAGQSPLSLIEIDRIDRLLPGPGDTPTRQLALAPGAASPGPVDEKISLSLRMPDLSGRGYALMGKETVHVAGERMVQLTYGRQDGQTFSVFLQPRSDVRTPQIELVRRKGFWVAYWREGPLASTLAARLSREEVRELARDIRREMQDQNRLTPTIQANPAPLALPGLAAGSGAPVPSESPGSRGVQPIGPAGILRTH